MTQATNGHAKLGNVLAGRLLAAAGDSVWGGRGCLLTFHRCVADAEWAAMPNRGFYVTAGYLDGLLAYLAQTGWAVVTMDEALARLASGDTRRFINVSVDDCYRDTAELVVPVFRSHGVPVTLFVTTGIPDATLSLWCAGLESVIGARSQVRTGSVVWDTVTADEKRAAYAGIAATWDIDDDGATARVRYSEFCIENEVSEAELHERHAVSWAMLRGLRDDPCVEIGAHTIDHRRLSSLDDAAAEGEIAGSRARLQEALGVPCRHFAFPYGRSGDCGRRDMALAQRAGFASAATTRKGLARRGGDPFGLPRNTINGGRAGAMMTQAHMLGATGLAARVLGRV